MLCRVHAFLSKNQLFRLIRNALPQRYWRLKGYNSQALLNLRPFCSLPEKDTVFSLSSGHGKCGVAVVRVSGPKASKALVEIIGSASLLEPRRATLHTLRDPVTGDPIDRGLVLWFPGPHSFTGEDSVEFHIHGGPAVITALLSTLGALSGFRHAEPGDFAKRAFFNGKLDLTEVEGLADLIHAETEAQRKQALRQMGGDLSRLYEKWRAELLKLVAYVEAVIDFGEDENIEEGVINEVKGLVSRLRRELLDHLDDSRRGERLRGGVNVTILGAPNVGKSSLLNMLCRRPAAIVSPYPGTTRDVLESALDIGGYPLILSDTAGVRGTEDPVEQEGVQRALRRAMTADLRILIGDISLLPTTVGQKGLSFAELAANLLQLSPALTQSEDVSKALDSLQCDNTMVVLNKVDLIPDSRLQTVLDRFSSFCCISCKSGYGVSQLVETLKSHLVKLCGNPGTGNPSITQVRHRTHITSCAQYLGWFLERVEDERNMELAAQELRSSIVQLGRLSGKVGIEEILDVIFRDFCIGK